MALPCKNYRSDNGRDAHARRGLQFLPNLYGLGCSNLIGISNDTLSYAIMIRSLQVLVEHSVRWCDLLDVEKLVSCKTVSFACPGTRKSRLSWCLVPGTLTIMGFGVLAVPRKEVVSTPGSDAPRGILTQETGFSLFTPKTLYGFGGCHEWLLRG